MLPIFLEIWVQALHLHPGFIPSEASTHIKTFVGIPAHVAHMPETKETIHGEQRVEDNPWKKTHEDSHPL